MLTAALIASETDLVGARDDFAASARARREPADLAMRAMVASQLLQLERAMNGRADGADDAMDLDLLPRLDRDRLPPNVAAGRFASIAMVAGPASADKRRTANLSTVENFVRSAVRRWNGAISGALVAANAGPAARAD